MSKLNQFGQIDKYRGVRSRKKKPAYGMIQIIKQHFKLHVCF